MMKWLGRLSLILLLSSCSAQWHLRKAVAKDPMILQRDTLVVVDTIVTQPVGITDTVILQQHDTISLIKDRLRVKIVKVKDTITIDAVCDSDTIVKTIRVPYEKVIYVEKEKPMQIVQRWILYLLSFVVGLKLLQRFVDKHI